MEDDQKTADKSATTMYLRQSEEVNELAKSLSIAQGRIEDAVKSNENPHYRSKYADLASVWHACRSALSSQGLAVIQSPSYTKGHVIVTTRLVHASGQWLEGSLAVPVAKADAHGVGSATTYARRYALSAMVGVAPDDDDGNAAVGEGNTATKSSAKQAAIDASGGRLAPASEIPVPDWTTWINRPDEVFSDEHPWYCQAVKGLFKHAGVSTAGEARAMLKWLMPDNTPTVEDAKGVAKVSRLVWEEITDRSNTVPFTRMLSEAQKGME